VEEGLASATVTSEDIASTLSAQISDG